MNTTIPSTIVSAKKMKTKTMKKAPKRIEFGRKVTNWQYCYADRDTLPDFVPVPKEGMTEEEETEWYDRMWDGLVARANDCDMIELDEEDGDANDDLDCDDCDIEAVFTEIADKIAEEDEAKKKAEEAAAVVVPVVEPEKTREELIAEIARLTAELEAIKEKMRNAMASLGY